MRWERKGPCYCKKRKKERKNVFGQDKMEGKYINFRTEREEERAIKISGENTKKEERLIKDQRNEVSDGRCDDNAEKRQW